MKDPAKLNLIQDRVFADPQFLPAMVKGDGGQLEEQTHCNQASHAVASSYECHLLWSDALQRVMTADEIYAFLQTCKDVARKETTECQKLVDGGALLFAVFSSQKLGKKHGHICTLTPGIPEMPIGHSGHWNKDTPLCLNIGGQGLCFRRKSLSYAFAIEPEIYAWIPSL